MKKKIKLSNGLLSLTIAVLFLLGCKKENISPPFNPTGETETKDQIVEMKTDEIFVFDLIENLIAYLDYQEKVLYVDYSHIDKLMDQFEPSDFGDSWMIEKNGQLESFFLAPLAELNLEKKVEEEDEFTRENEYCKKITECFYGRTHQKYFKFTEETPMACVVKKEETCTGTKKEFEVEEHSDNNCLSPKKDEDGNIVLKKITIVVCSR